MNDRQRRFVVIGTYVSDCYVHTSELPAWGNDREVRSIRTAPGGKALNQAVALARLGGHVTAVGAVGDDGPGQEILGTLAREGVDTASGVQVRDEAATQICVGLVNDDGETSFLWHAPEAVAVTPETVKAAAPAIENADAVLITFEVPLETVWESIELAHRNGATVIVQPAPPPRDANPATNLPWDKVDVLVPNAAEARTLLFGYSPDTSLAEGLSSFLRVPSVVVTYADDGCVLFSNGGPTSYPAREVPEVVDTTGASDAFTAALAWRCADGAPITKAVQAALSAAASAISTPGGYDSMPFADALFPTS